MKHVRTASEANNRPQARVTLSFLLKVLNPNGLGHIPLDDMKHTLDRVPESCRQKVEVVFHSYIFTYHSFKLPIDAFMKLYEQSEHLNRRTPNPRDHSPTRPSPSPLSDALIDTKKCRGDANHGDLKRRLKHLSQERRFITYDHTFRDLVNTYNLPPRGLTTIRTPLGNDRGHNRRTSEEADISLTDGTYSGLHQRKVSLRKEQEWEDIKVAQALAIGKARTRSPGALETEFDGAGSCRGKGNQCNQSDASTDETAKSILAAIMQEQEPVPKRRVKTRGNLV